LWFEHSPRDFAKLKSELQSMPASRFVVTSNSPRDFAKLKSELQSEVSALGVSLNLADISIVLVGHSTALCSRMHYAQHPVGIMSTQQSAQAAESFANA